MGRHTKSLARRLVMQFEVLVEEYCLNASIWKQLAYPERRDFNDRLVRAFSTRSDPRCVRSTGCHDDGRAPKPEWGGYERRDKQHEYADRPCTPVRSSCEPPQAVWERELLNVPNRNVGSVLIEDGSDSKSKLGRLEFLKHTLTIGRWRLAELPYDRPKRALTFPLLAIAPAGYHRTDGERAEVCRVQAEIQGGNDDS